MKKSNPLVRGFYAGLIAGIFGAITSFILSFIFTQIIGLWPTPASAYEISFRVVNHIILNIIWVIIFGVIYAVVYDLVPGEGTMKGLAYGLILYLITSFRTASFYMVTETWDMVMPWAVIGIYHFPIIGIILGYLYKPSK